MAEEKKTPAPKAAKPRFVSSGQVGHRTVSRSSVVNAAVALGEANARLDGLRSVNIDIGDRHLPIDADKLVRPYRKALALQKRAIGHLNRGTYA